jgi:hypothetical protein
MEIIKLKTGFDLLESSVSESLYDEYDDEATYSTDDLVYVSYESDGTTERTPHEIYQSLADANTGNYPPTSAAKWGYIGTTNQWAMFDDYVNTQTEDSTDITVKIDSSQTNRVGLFNLYAQHVTLTLYVDGVVKKTETLDLDDSPVFDYWGYFFGDFSYKADVAWEYPYYGESELEITIDTYGGASKCGICAIGKSYQIGISRFGSSLDIRDYSKKSTDEWGNTYLAQGNWTKRNEIQLWVYNSELDHIYRLLASLCGTPVIVDANNETTYESLLVYGFLERPGEIIISGPTVSKCSIEVIGLV